MVDKYDQNDDYRLSQHELSWTSERFDFLDTDGNRKLDREELAFISRTPVDLDLVVDLDPVASAPAMRLLATSGRRLDVSRRPDFAKIQFPGAVVTFARRYVNPIAAALENAMIEFNRMDIDGNGYLEREETTQRIRFARGWFEAIDFDADGKIFGEEMEEYVRVRSEPAATSCHVNIYDTGRGFFMALDSNGDGRIGVRECRVSSRSLASLERDGRQGVSAGEPDQHFHIEFVRGSYRMFGPAERLVDQAPAFTQRAFVGPIWFQRMDRNGDGDLAWSEFFGPRDVFHRLDHDRDDLIDPQEAAAADTLFPVKASESP